MIGTVYLVGAGPGSPDLLTVRAARLLAAADIVFHDALVNPEIVALAAGAEKVAVGKRCAKHSTAQAFINKRLIDAARKHRTVVRLKGGDPMLFGRAQEELDTLRAAGVPCEVVPGITAALAAAADLKTSLTRRGLSRNVVFATPRVGEGEAPSEWAAPLAHADTAALYMGAGQADAIAQTLLAQGRSPRTPVVAIENASLPTSRTVGLTLATLPALAEREFAGPVLLLIGEVFSAATAVEAARSPERRASR
jgi:uroporphyrin-III C-methyltransferase